MKSLVTGGAGFIGSRVANELLQMGHQVVVLDDLSGGFIENVNPECVFVKGSVLDDQLLKELFKTHKFDYVFHFAAYAAEGLSHFIKRFNYNNNLIGSVNLINESIKNSYRARNNQISNDNVQQATKSLIGSVNKKGPKIANIFGGILLGAFFTLFLKFCTENTMNHVETLFMMIFGIAGTVLIVYGILIE